VAGCCSQIGVSSHQTKPDSNLVLAHAYNLANGGQQSIFAPCFRPPKYPPKWGRMGRNQRSSETLVY
jgi:hypothetical protein